MGTEKGIAYQHDFLHVGDIDFCSCALAPVDDCGAYFLGLSGASVFLSAVRLSMLWFRPQYWGVSSGALTATSKVGGMLASIVFPLLTMHYTWRAVSYSLLFLV